MLIHDPIMLQTQETPPPALLPWLIYQDSMTDRLKQINGDAQLIVLRQDWKEAGVWERHYLGLDEESLIQREILIASNQIPYWYARTLIPKNTYDNHLSLFNRLENESLGALIFSEATIRREQHLYYPVDSKSAEYAWVPESLRQGAQQFWARVAIFSVEATNYFCLIEILLPPTGALE